ncbi:hypothetical protein EYZ11_001932 [Aspergillus tanneri]|uniref:Uncharacterized protein n=1 Tax=Aspergillus tanneri TaxID=1220188 RepID=A0A4S3JSS7_9EURO|nr:hypothetical protein EYZ11_001932 [Aspergillus tanneri]
MQLWVGSATYRRMREQQRWHPVDPRKGLSCSFVFDKGFWNIHCLSSIVAGDNWIRVAADVKPILPPTKLGRLEAGTQDPDH